MTENPARVLRETKGMYDPNPVIRTITAQAMVKSRQWVPTRCEAPGCIDPATGEPKLFLSRVVKGKPERRACGTAHRLRLWRREMRDKGYRQISRGGVTGWLTPEGAFHPNPSQPKRRPPTGRPVGRPRKGPAPVAGPRRWSNPVVASRPPVTR